ncbi:MAG TPA: hypothetical protein PKC30_15145 [Saprospiraceae bacterium]|nr:hypothetical protein [Saprospiraceae bacterium]
MKILLVIPCFLLLFSCTKPLPGCTFDKRDDLEMHFLQSPFHVYLDAMFNYEVSPEENCEDLKTAISNFIKAYEDLIDCTRSENDNRNYEGQIFRLKKDLEFYNC